MKKTLCLYIILLAVLAASCAYVPKKNMSPSVLVIPSRYTIVQLAFDIARLRPVTMVAYDNDNNDVLMHVWNQKLQEWVKTDMDEYASGSLVEPAPGYISVLGSDADMPAGLVDASQWCPVVEHISSLNIMSVINKLDEKMKFSKSEWKWLAERHDLKIKDFNWERRRYGKYGPPDGKARTPMPEEEIAEELKDEPMPELDVGEEAQSTRRDAVEAPMLPEDK